MKTQQNTETDRRVLVTGASRGIGREIALMLAREGFSVTVHCKSSVTSAEDVCETIRQGGGQADMLQFDVSDRLACRDALERQLAENGAYYGVVCNAGITRDNAFPALTDADWDDVINTNLGGFYNVVKPLVMPMIGLRQGGRVVAMSSASGISGNRGQTNYSASKAGLIGAVKALSVELAKRRITVNCVAPGLIETEMVEEHVIEEAMKMIPAKRMGTAREVASLVAYLFSEDAAYLTRQVISVNGGMF